MSRERCIRLGRLASSVGITVESEIMEPVVDGEFNLNEALQILERTPATLGALLGDLSPAWLSFQEDPEAWNPFVLLIHFIHNERANWIPRVRVILSEGDHREFPPFRQLPENGLRIEKPTGELLAEFAQLRQESLVTLRGLDLKLRDFDRQARHPVLGTVSLRQLLATWVVHDLNHIHQIAKTLAKRYREAVGPWRRNLAILDI